MLNIKFIQMDIPKREKNLSIFAKRLGELNQRYLQVKKEVHEFADEQGLDPNEIRYAKEYPDYIEW